MSLPIPLVWDGHIGFFLNSQVWKGEKANKFTVEKPKKENATR